jgi:hypothetical protein
MIDMNAIDAFVLGLLAILDFGVLVYLRRRHNRAWRAQRVMRSLELAVRREIEEASSRRRGRQLLHVSQA